jgi:hypothetical protein
MLNSKLNSYLASIFFPFAQLARVMRLLQPRLIAGSRKSSNMAVKTSLGGQYEGLVFRFDPLFDKQIMEALHHLLITRSQDQILEITSIHD